MISVIHVRFIWTHPKMLTDCSEQFAGTVSSMSCDVSVAFHTEWAWLFRR